MDYKINYGSQWFNLEKLHLLLKKYKWDCWYLVVISPNGVGKTLFMLEAFKLLLSENKLCGFVVRNKTSDYYRPLSLIQKLNTKTKRYVYNKKNYVIYEENLENVNNIKKQKWVRKEVGYIVNIYDAWNIKSFPINDCYNWFFDEVSNAVAEYSKEEISALKVIIKASGRHSINQGWNIMLFGNMDDPHNIYLDEFKKLGKKYEKYFSVINSKIEPKMTKILWKYEPNADFINNTKGSVTDLVTEFDEKEILMAKTTDGFKNKFDDLIMTTKFAILKYSIIIGGSKFSIYEKDKYIIVSEFIQSKKPLKEIYVFDIDFRKLVSNYFFSARIKFTNKKVLQDFNNLVRIINL